MTNSIAGSKSEIQHQTIIPSLCRFDVKANLLENKEGRILTIEHVPFGYQLHKDKLFDFITNEQHWKLIQEFRITNAHDHIALIDALGVAINGYRWIGARPKSRMTIYGRRARLHRIVDLSAKLRMLIKADELVSASLGRVPPPGTDPAKRAEIGRRRVDRIHKLLIEATRRAEEWYEAAESAKYGRRLLSGTRMSPERLFIWETILPLCNRLWGRVGYTENGPIMRILTIIHSALGIDAPKGESVRQTINDFNGKPRSKLRDRIHGAQRQEK